MFRLCSFFTSRYVLPPRLISTTAANAASKQSQEEKIGFPVRPKKPPSPFLRYLASIRPVLRQKYPEAKTTDLTKYGAEQWGKVDPSLRAKIEEEYKKEYADYSKAFKAYQESLTDEQIQEIEDEREEKREAKEKRQFRKKLKELGKPKKSATAFVHFLKDKLPSRKESQPYKDFLQSLAKEWDQLDDKVKDKYRQKTKQDIERYRQEIQAWEERMIRLGHIDVVRNEVLIDPSSKRQASKQRATTSVNARE